MPDGLARDGEEGKSRGRNRSKDRYDYKKEGGVVAHDFAEKEFEEEAGIIDGGGDQLFDDMEKADSGLALYDDDATRIDGRRGGYQSLYRQLEGTREWVENNYYKLSLIHI